MIFSLLQGGRVQIDSSWAADHAENRPTALTRARLYFADPDQARLTARERLFASGIDPRDFGVNILNGLFEPDALSGFKPFWPPGTSVRAFFMGQDGRAFVDLAVKGFKSGEAGIGNTDTISELLAVYAMVNSLTLNIPQIREVKILINGSDAKSLGGHVSLDGFFKSNLVLVK